MKEWYIARGSKKYGPFTTDDVILLRQHGKAFEYDLVWKQGLRQWRPLIQTEEFSMHAIAEIAGREDAEKVLNRRQWPRAKKEVALLLHNEDLVWTARTLCLSLGGALIQVNTPHLKPGEIIHIHFRAENNVDKASIEITDQKPEQSFSCEAVISGKRFNPERIHHNSPVQYAVRFCEMDHDGETQIRDWVGTFLTQKNHNLKGANHVTANR